MAGDVFASHYAEPLARTVKAGPLHVSPANDSEAARKLEDGEKFMVLEDSLGWAWGYAASDHRVGYVRSDSLTAG